MPLRWTEQASRVHGHARACIHMQSSLAIYLSLSSIKINEHTDFLNSIFVTISLFRQRNQSSVFLIVFSLALSHSKNPRAFSALMDFSADLQIWGKVHLPLPG